MTHLDMDQLLALAEAASEGLGFDEKQVEELEHLKECEECYEQFCLLSVLHDATDPAGGYVFARPQEMAAPILEKEFSGEEALQPVKTGREKVLAAVRVFCRKMADGVEWAMEQVEQPKAYFRFAPALAAATRGGTAGTRDILRLEEYEDEKTRITFDPDKGELVVQLPADAMEDASVRVYLVAEEDGSREELVLERHGRVLQGVSRQVPKGEFQVNIEAGEE